MLGWVLAWRKRVGFAFQQIFDKSPVRLRQGDHISSSPIVNPVSFKGFSCPVNFSAVFLDDFNQLQSGWPIFLSFRNNISIRRLVLPFFYLALGEKAKILHKFFFFLSNGG